MAFSRRKRDDMVARLQSGHRLTNRERSMLTVWALREKHMNKAQALSVWEQLAANRVSRIVAKLESR
jgi:hypothetical protein